MTSQLRPALIIFALLTLLTGVAYPALMTLIGQSLFPHKASGSLVQRGEEYVGSELLGQAFTADRYFWSRPSATDPAYNAGSSTGSNLGPTNPALLEAIQERVKALQAHPGHKGGVPIDLVTTSGSGLDPHISPAAAEYQLVRVTKARTRLTAEQVRQLVADHTEGRTLGVLGEPRVNVLTLNLALDRLEGRTAD